MFTIDSGVTASISGLTITDGSTSASGGGILNYGALTLTGVTISANSARYGGGIRTQGGSLNVYDCTITANSAVISGAGIEADNNITVISTTFAENAAGATSGGGGAIDNPSGSYTVTVGNSIFYGDSCAYGPEVANSVHSLGHNLVSDAYESSGWVASDKTGTQASPLQAGLGPLGSYGGPTLTIPLLPGSPAIGSGAILHGVTTDQRGLIRGTTVDIGAFQTSVVVESNGNSAVTTASGMTLPGAISLANTYADTQITFASSVTSIILGGSELALADILGETSITGPGVTVSGGGKSTVFAIDSGVTASISGLTITGGSTTGFGGGVLNDGTVTLSTCIVSGNSASNSGAGLYNSSFATLTLNYSTVSGNTASKNGGGLYNKGTLTLNNSTVSGNTAKSGGGGLYNKGTIELLTDSTVSGNTASKNGGGLYNKGTITLMTDSTVSGNSATNGGGLYNRSGGSATLTYCTVAGNSASSAGGGVFSKGTATLTNCTVAGNSASSAGGGILNGATAALTNCTVAGNSASSGGGIFNNSTTSATLGNTIVATNTATTGPDVDGAFTSNGYNLIGKRDGSSGFTATGDLTGTTASPLNPKLGTLGNYGGPTQTIPILPGSPAIGHGSTNLSSVSSNDQRGFQRIVNAMVDIGAFEDQMSLPSTDLSSIVATVAIPYTFTNNPSASNESDLGTFSDTAVLAPTTYTVTINWGDGTTATSYTLGSTTSLDDSAATPASSLSHVYSTRGTDTITVTVSDADGDAGSFSIAATVGPAQVNPGLLESYASSSSSTTESQNASYVYGASVTFAETFSAGGTLAPTGTVDFHDGTTDLGTATLQQALDSSENPIPGEALATITTSSLVVGQNQLITATYTNSDGNYTAPPNQPNSNESCTVTINGDPTTTGLSASTTSPVYGQSVTFTATVTVPAGSSSPTGSVEFFDNGNPLESTKAFSTVSLGINAEATIQYAFSDLNTHPITAVYTPDTSSSDLAGSTSSPAVSIIPAQAGTTTTVSSSSGSNSVTYGTSVTLTASVTSGDTNVSVANGTVKFYNGSTYLGGDVNDVTISGGTATAALTLSTLPAGTDSITAKYTPPSGSSSSIAGSTSATTPVTVNKATLTVTTNSQAIDFNDPLPTLTGSISGLVNNDNITATYSTTVTSAPPSNVGPYPITFTLVDPGNKLGNYSVITNDGTLTIGAAPTQTTLSATNPTQATYGNTLSVVATVQDTDTHEQSPFVTPGGTVTFVATPQGGGSAITLGGTSVSSSGKATLSTTENVLAAGTTYNITADFADTGTYVDFGASSSGTGMLAIIRATPTITPSFASGYLINSPSLAGIGSAAAITPSDASSNGQKLEGVGLVYTFYSGAMPVTLNYVEQNSGSYTVVVSFAGSTDYAGATAGPFSFTVGAEPVPTIDLSAPNEVYNGSPYTLATATLTPSGPIGDVTDVAGTSLEGVGLTLLYYAGSAATGTALTGAPAGPGTFTVQASFAGSTDYGQNSVTATFSIAATSAQVDGLEFLPAGSGSFAVANGVYTSDSAGVQIGFVPAAGETFVALAELEWDRHDRHQHQCRD